MSTASRISILSDEFIATAHSDEDNKITCKVKRHPPLSRFLYKNENLPIPKLVRLILFSVDAMTKKGWALLGLYVFSEVLLDTFFPSIDSTAISAFLKQYWLLVYVSILVGVLTYINRQIATWHGAEHMAIAAYDRNGSTTTLAITHECPVHDECGGRLFIPLFVGIVIANVIANKFELNETITTLAVLECALWVDTLKGWDKIPGTSHASHFLQKWVTTRYPGEQEMRTAQRALQELVTAHLNS